MKPERIQLFGSGGLFSLFLRAVIAFLTHDDAADFSKTVRRIANSVDAKVSLWIDDDHTLTVEITAEGEEDMSEVEEEVAERIRIAYSVLTSKPRIV